MTMKLIPIISAIAVAAQAQIPAAARKAPIADNSFFIEEAYNQEAGVVQHISGFARVNGQRGWGHSFTQEWPFTGQRHQLSYTVPIINAGSPVSTGVGDLMLNYRLQAIMDEARGIAFSPRVSLSLPTGDEQRGFGLGGTGVQVNFPVSKMFGSSFVAHSNIGGTWFNRAPGAGDASTRLRAINVGQSIIWLAASRFNVMLETAWTRTTAQSDGGSRTEETAFLIPGIRWGHDFKSGLQIVPGIAFPIGVGKSDGTNQLFLYVSFEHPFTKAAAAAQK